MASRWMICSDLRSRSQTNPRKESCAFRLAHLHGFLGIDGTVNPGYDEVSYVVRIRTDATREKVEKLHEMATRTSVNLANFSKPIRMAHRLEILED